MCWAARNGPSERQGATPSSSAEGEVAQPATACPSILPGEDCRQLGDRPRSCAFAHNPIAAAAAMLQLRLQAAARLMAEGQGAALCQGASRHWSQQQQGQGSLRPAAAAAAAAAPRWHSHHAAAEEPSAEAEQDVVLYEAPFATTVKRVKASPAAARAAAAAPVLTPPAPPARSRRTLVSPHACRRPIRAPTHPAHPPAHPPALQKLSLFSCACAVCAGPIILGLDATTTLTAKASITATLASFGMFTTGLVSRDAVFECVFVCGVEGVGMWGVGAEQCKARGTAFQSILHSIANQCGSTPATPPSAAHLVHPAVHPAPAVRARQRHGAGHHADAHRPPPHRLLPRQ